MSPLHADRFKCYSQIPSQKFAFLWGLLNLNTVKCTIPEGCALTFIWWAFPFISHSHAAATCTANVRSMPFILSSKTPSMWRPHSSTWHLTSFSKSCFNCLRDSWSESHNWPQSVNMNWSCLLTARWILMSTVMLTFISMMNHCRGSSYWYSNDSLLCRLACVSTTDHSLNKT